jgi:hypothetical protein
VPVSFTSARFVRPARKRLARQFLVAPRESYLPERGADFERVLVRQRPDEPLGRVKLPRLHSVTVIMLKFVVVVEIAFAHGGRASKKESRALHLVEYGCRPIV